MKIQNTCLQIDFDATTHRLTCTSPSTNTPFAETQYLQINGATCTDLTHKTFGSGQGITLTSSHGDTHLIALFENMPFVLFRSTLNNLQNEPRHIQNLRTTIFSLHLQTTTPHALGTAGLTPPNAHSGSYAFLAIADPKTQTGIVSGWITHERGSGVIFSPIENDRVQLIPQLDYGNLIIPPNETADTEWFALGYFTDARLGLEAYADAIAQYYTISLPTQPSGYCTWYAEKHGGASDAQHLSELADFAKDHLQPFGLTFVQIDDKWQKGERRNGPAKNFTTHHPQGPYPCGMKPTADDLTAHQFTPGLWFMPFACDHEDPFFSQHPDWIVRQKNGDPYETRWGGTSLDMTHPGAQAYLRDVVHRITHDWGYRYIKIDGLWTGSATEILYINTHYKEDGIGNAIFHNPEKTNLEAYRDGLRFIRQTAGDNVYILGCNVSQNLRTLGGTFGLVDAMRIGPDNGAKWDALKRGPQHGTRHYFFHRRVWHNDPDPVYVRATMPHNHAQLIASWIGISGQLCVNSDWLPDLPQERLDLLKRIMPAHALQARPIDLFQNDPARVWLISDETAYPSRHILALYNWNDDPLTFDLSLHELGLSDKSTYAVFNFWDGIFLPPIENKITLSVPAQSCCILALREQRDHPLVVSTSRHITQGIIDLQEETWHPDTNILRGTSQLVANDPYELRIATNKHVCAIKFSDPNMQAGLHINHIFHKNDGLYISLQCPENRAVQWQIHFV